MERDLYPHMRRVKKVAADLRGEDYRMESFEDSRALAPWSSGPGGTQSMQGRESLDSFERAPPYSQPLPTYNAGPSRLSLPPRTSQAQPSSQYDREPRTITSADNHFRVAMNLREGMPLRQPPPPAGQAMFDILSPMGQLANAMVMQRSMPLSNLVREPVNTFQGLQNSRLNQLQPPKQQITPPFNLNGFTQSPMTQKSSASSSPMAVQQSSSPTARISQRRSTYHPTPSDTYMEPEEEFGEHFQDPVTPLRQMAPPQQNSQTFQVPPEQKPHTIALRHAPVMAHGIQLVSPHELPDRFRQVFPYELFNAAQSKCFGPIYRTNDNVVVSAPTGSGKTALLELAICKLVQGHPNDQFKIVYQAPTKSLCSERVRDWSKKFCHLNLHCAELTGDTNQSEMARVREASIIVTTPEKWDSITRKWSDHHKLVQMVKLFLIDEVHILKDTRGATLEAVVSRMKSMGADVRFVALSATVPNSHDIAVWLGKDHTNQHLPAHRETFGEEFRPVKLKKQVHGYEAFMNDFAFEKLLDGKLPGLIQRYTHKKPIMVFCFTRKSCENTATILAEWWLAQRPQDRSWSAPSQRIAVASKELQALVVCGVAFHHAGLDLQDRHAVETGFLKGDINVICCTSTLAVGVNLPCHTVVLKGTMGFQDGRLTEYSDLEVMQMLGRAGRPQFDDSAVAVIMTRSEKVDRYKKMVAGQDILESTLHLGLIEHLNSEISLGAVRDLYQAKRWLCGTFLSVRMRQNPDYYKIEGIEPNGDTDQRLERVCERDIKLLQDSQLVVDDHQQFKCTEYGEAMCRYMVQFETMKLLLSIPTKAKTGEILNIICQAVEFKDLRMKPNERPVLREFNKSPFIKFPISESITTTAHKISLLIQVQLGGVEYPTNKDLQSARRQFMVDKSIIFDRIQRLIRCVVDCKSENCDAVATRHALELARSLSAEYWENSNLQLRQIPQVGPAATRRFVTKGINSIEKLMAKETSYIEMLMSKNPPYGKKMKDELIGFPQLRLEAEIQGQIPTKSSKIPKIKIKVKLSYLNEKVPVWNRKRPSLTFTAETSSGLLVHFWRGNVMKLEKNGYDLKFEAELTDPEEEIRCSVACDEIVGTIKSSTLKHDLPAAAFPPPDTTEKPKQTDLFKEGAFSETDEFGGSELDEDLLNAVKSVEKPKSDYGSDDFDDIDDLEGALAKKASKRKPKEDEEIQESIRMSNGKWTCFHDCRDNKPLKNGKQCKHKCCHEGLDKKPKARVRSSRKDSEVSVKRSDSKQRAKTSGEQSSEKYKKKSPESHANTSSSSAAKLKAKSTRANRNSGSLDDMDDVEVVDLAADRPSVGYEDLAPREYRKLHKLHSSVNPTEKEGKITIKQNPQFSYTNGSQPNLPFLQKKDNDRPDDEFGSSISDEDLPSLSSLLPKDDDILGQDDDPFGDDAMAYQKASTTSYDDGSIASLEAGMMDLDESSMLMPPAPPPQGTSSFVNDVFDFGAFSDDDAAIEKQLKVSPRKPLLKDPSASLPVSRKREYSEEIEEPEVKHRRVTESEAVMKAPKNPSLPAWVNEFDSDIIDGLKDFVDFVD